MPRNLCFMMIALFWCMLSASENHSADASQLEWQICWKRKRMWRTVQCSCPGGYAEYAGRPGLHTCPGLYSRPILLVHCHQYWDFCIPFQGGFLYLEVVRGWVFTINQLMDRGRIIVNWCLLCRES